MTAKTDKFDDIACFINPYQQEISINMALHTTFVFAMKHMRLIFGRDWLLIHKNT